MNWITVAFIVGVALLIWGLVVGYHGGGRAISGGLVAGTAALIGILAAIEVWGFQPKMAELAQVRSAVERLGCGASEDVIGKAADWNATIVGARIWNRRWLGDPFYNDGVDTVTTIVIPDCK
jgi:hypothetical protein